MGHLEGITFIDSRGDGRYLISNGKDQTTKLSDIRKMSSRNMYPRITDRDWDYRWMESTQLMQELQDILWISRWLHIETILSCALQFAVTFLQHIALGQNYIYTGSGDHSVYIYDLVTGAQVAKLCHHDGPVKDCSWHPTYPMLVSSSWDGSIVRWEFLGDDQVPILVKPRARRRRAFY